MLVIMLFKGSAGSQEALDVLERNRGTHCREVIMDQQSLAVVPANQGMETGRQARDDAALSPPCAAAPARS